MELITPFEPIRTDTIPTGEDWVAQVKWDGVRILTYWNGQSVQLFNRKKNERTAQYPELAEIQSYCPSSSVILDGEVIALEKGKPSFHKVMSRDGLRKLENLESIRKKIPIAYMVFDLLFYNGEWMTSRTLQERQEILQKILHPTDFVYTVENFQDGLSLFQAIKAQAMEGVVCKDLRSSYIQGGKDARWQKVKNYRDLHAVVGGVTLRGSIINSLLLGAHDPEGRLWYIGHAGTGKLTNRQWQELTYQLLPLQQRNSPFVNKPSRALEALWIKPQMTVKVQFIEWTEGGMLRQPSIHALNLVSPQECILE